MTSSYPLAQAKQGDPLAIAGLLNRSLRPKGITATVDPIDQGLQIHLQTDQDIAPAPLLQFIHQGLLRLQPQQIQHAEICLYRPGQIAPIWSGSCSLTAAEPEEEIEFPPLSAEAPVDFPPLPPQKIPAASHPSLAPGQILKGRYRLAQLLSDTVVRQTWLATDLQLAGSGTETVVVKLLAFGGQMQWTDFKLFEREAQILQHLRHGQIPAYRDYFSIEGTRAWFGIVYAFVPGCSLKDLVQHRQRLSEAQVVQVAQDVLEVLIYLHGLNPPVLHRDIKPSNLIWGEDGRTYVVDFGSVQDQATPEGRTFTVVGTYGYAPMEQFGGRAIPASDLYGLGATLIHLLTGSSPADLPQQELRIQFSDRVSARPALVRWIGQLVEPAPEHRFATARQALSALQTALNPKAGSAQISKPVLHSAEMAALVTASRNPDLVLNTFATPDLVPQQKPYGSQVQVYSSPTDLRIYIPSARLSALGVKLGLGMLMITVPLWLLMGVLGLGVGTALAPLIGVGTTLFALRHDLTETELRFDRRLFTLTHTYLGIRQCHQGSTEPILDVYQETLFPAGAAESGSRPLGFQITIQVGVRGFSLGRSLSRVECLWLAQTIKQWLGIG